MVQGLEGVHDTLQKKKKNVQKRKEKLQKEKDRLREEEENVQKDEEIVEREFSAYNKVKEAVDLKIQRQVTSEGVL